MPLSWGRIVGHDEVRLVFVFLMLDGDQPVQCQISDAALDHLAGTKGSPAHARKDLFLRNQDAIEAIASELFRKARPGSVVRIFSKHIPEQFGRVERPKSS